MFDAIGAIRHQGKRYDIVTANAMLHHIPDYEELIRRAVAILSPHGQFFSFQYPLRYDSLARSTVAFSTVAYLSWRMFKGDIVSGLKRRIRRTRGIYSDECPQDSIEYHVIRGGVDQNSIVALLKTLGYEPRIVTYFSTQSRVWQLLGAALGIKNTFGIVAQR